MNKLALIVYTLITSLIYTGLVAYFSTEGSGIALGYIAAALVAATALIAFGREKISDFDHKEKLKEKEAEIEALKRSVKQQRAMLHSVKSKVIHVVINISDKERFHAVMCEIASSLNENPTINNIELDEGGDVSDYLQVLKLNADAK